MIFHALDADGLKCSEADVQSNLDGFDSALADAVEDFSREMKAGSRRGHRSALLGINGLIALAIGQRIRRVQYKEEAGRARCDPGPRKKFSS